MFKYSAFGNKPEKTSTIFKMFQRHLQEHQCEPADRIITTMPKPFIKLAGSGKNEFCEKVRIVCQKTDLSLFLNPCKVIFVGDVKTGKSALINRFTNNRFDHEYKSTIGVDFQVERFNIINVPYTLHLFDTCSQARFKCMSQVYYRNANIIVVVFDMTLPSTLNNAIQWLKEALITNEKTDPTIFLVGTKADLVSKRSMALIEKDAIEVAQQMNAEFFAVSAFTSCQVTKFFQRLTAVAFEKEVQKAITPPDINLFGNNIMNLGVFRKETKKKGKFLSKWLKSCTS